VLLDHLHALLHHGAVLHLRVVRDRDSGERSKVELVEGMGARADNMWTRNGVHDALAGG